MEPKINDGKNNDLGKMSSPIMIPEASARPNENLPPAATKVATETMNTTSAENSADPRPPTAPILETTMKAQERNTDKSPGVKVDYSGASSTSPSSSSSSSNPTTATGTKQTEKDNLDIGTTTSGPKTALQCTFISVTPKDTSRSYIDDPGALNLGKKKVGFDTLLTFHL